jgi:allophanate hydrolase
VAVVGAHLSGMPLNSQLTERGARLLKSTETAADYKLYALPNTVPPKPGLLRVAPGTGTSIAVEIWELAPADYGSFVSLIPSPMGIGTLALADGSSVQGFICEPLALQGATDISHFGGWRAYLASLQPPR